MFDLHSKTCHVVGIASWHIHTQAQGKKFFLKMQRLAWQQKINTHTYTHFHFSCVLTCLWQVSAFFSKFILIRIYVNNFCILFFSNFLCLLSNRKRPLALFNRFLISSSHQMLFFWRCYPLNTLIFIVICIAVALFCWK